MRVGVPARRVGRSALHSPVKETDTASVLSVLPLLQKDRNLCLVNDYLLVKRRIYFANNSSRNSIVDGATFRSDGWALPLDLNPKIKVTGERMYL